MTRFESMIIIGVIIVLGLLWHMTASYELVPDYILPSPTDVIRAIIAGWSRYLFALLNTLGTALIGFGIAIIFGLVSGLILYESRILHRILLPCFIAIKSTPIIAIVPIVTLLLKVGFLSKLTLAFTACFFPMIISTYAGLHNVPESLHHYALSMRASRMSILWHLSLPSAANELAVGVKITLPLAFVGAVVAEMAGGDDAGIGYLIIAASYRLDSARLYAGVILLMILSSMTYYTMTSVIGRINPSYREGT